MLVWLTLLFIIFAVFDPSPLTVCINCIFYIYFMMAESESGKMDWSPDSSTASLSESTVVTTSSTLLVIFSSNSSSNGLVADKRTARAKPIQPALVFTSTVSKRIYALWNMLFLKYPILKVIYTLLCPSVHTRCSQHGDEININIVNKVVQRGNIFKIVNATK